jgi:murein DD-endopeptidase MepM/ murein hydrolase activator NlpD
VARLVNPWPEGRTINARSRYGPRTHPITGRPGTFHHGVDVAGTFPVTAAADGVVQKVSWNATGGGHVCIIDHGDLVTVYYHGAQKTKLKKGERVQAGQFIYTSGSTGASTGAHLHFEVRRPGGRWGDTMNPEDFLPKPGETVTPEPVPQPTPEPVVDRLPESQPVPRPQPPQVKPTYNRPITADHMARLKEKFKLYPRRGWFS